MSTYQRPDNGMVSDYLDKNKKMYDYGEKQYYYSDNDIMEYHNHDKVKGDMLLMR